MIGLGEQIHRMSGKKKKSVINLEALRLEISIKLIK
jgi:hypothetical protein